MFLLMSDCYINLQRPSWHDVQLVFIWQSRDADADMLSRVEDSSEIFLSHAAFQHVCLLRTGGRIWGCPTLDVFAGGARGQHVLQRFYSLFYTPGAIGANAMYQCWQLDARRPGRAGLLWVFPPFPLIAAVINKLLVEQVDAILILPRLMRFWSALLSKGQQSGLSVCLSLPSMSCLTIQSCIPMGVGHLSTCRVWARTSLSIY